jgi:tRNA A-37 threonylcarbamoyl transferase component Bud32
MFLHDKLPPNAILIEYIPNLHQIDLANFSEDRVKRLRQILDDMHQAQVLHHDAWPRNMCVSESQDRVLWIDFDSAQTFSEERPITDRHKLWFDREVELVEDFLSLLVRLTMSNHDLGLTVI